jgi:hypothetical protein
MLMSEPEIWVVWGGIFTDTRFEALKPGTEELHGPFHDALTARRVWQEKTARNVDIASHRLFIMRAQPETA